MKFDQTAGGGRWKELEDSEAAKRTSETGATSLPATVPKEYAAGTDVKYREEKEGATAGISLQQLVVVKTGPLDCFGGWWQLVAFP